jgi:hypothetical protein
MIYLFLDLLFFFNSLDFMLDIFITLLQLRQSVFILFQFLWEVGIDQRCAIIAKSLLPAEPT